MKKVMHSFLALVLALVLGVTGFAVAGGKSKDAAEFYKGKTITVVVATSAGGGFDVQTRVVTPYFEKYTGATTIVRNMPAGGGLQGRNHIFAAKPDGLTIALIEHGPKMITAGLFGSEGVRYQWDRFVPLGKVMHSPVALLTAKNLPWNKPEDLVGKNFIHGASRPFYGPQFAEALGWSGMQIVPGMGTPERALAMRRGEIQTSIGGASVLAANRDLLKPIVATVRAEEHFPGAPGVADAALPDRKKWGDYLVAWDKVMYWAITSPGVPAERVQFMEAALQKVWMDPGFRKDLKKIRMDLPTKFIGSKELKMQMDGLTALSSEDTKEMEHVIRRKYVKKR